MIANLTGTVTDKQTDSCIIDVGGVGYLVHISISTFELLPKTGDQFSLKIYTYVREDTIRLYGFATYDEKTIFQKLISISGVGPKMAISILSGMPINTLIDAIVNKDIARLNVIPGVGKKTAERIILELKDKVKSLITSVNESNVYEGKSKLFEDAVSALLNLGYKRQIIENALKKTLVSDSIAIEEVIKSTLRELNRL